MLEHELRRKGHKVLRRVTLPVTFEGMTVDLGYRTDLLVDDEVVLELKASEGTLPVHKAQLASYLTEWETPRFAD